MCSPDERVCAAAYIFATFFDEYASFPHRADGTAWVRSSFEVSDPGRFRAFTGTRPSDPPPGPAPP